MLSCYQTANYYLSIPCLEDFYVSVLRIVFVSYRLKILLYGNTVILIHLKL